MWRELEMERTNETFWMCFFLFRFRSSSVKSRCIMTFIAELTAFTVSLTVTHNRGTLSDVPANEILMEPQNEYGSRI